MRTPSPPLADHDADLTGHTILHYRIAERLGSGGMGRVYLAEDLKLRRQVALKFLPPLLQNDHEHRARLIREARAASALASPYIVHIHDIEEHQGRLFIVMEYVAGEPLSEILQKGPLPVMRAVELGEQMADALCEAHERGVIHRDIKSSNVVIDGRGQARLLDFGLAKSIGGGGSPAATVTRAPGTMSGVVLGTLSYMSPEQALGRSIDQRSDLFSLGVVLYEMLTGRLPFEGESLTEVVDHIVHGEPPALARLNYEVTPELEGIVRKALEKDPTLRYQSARDIAIDLQRVRREPSRPSDSGPLEIAAAQGPASIAVAPFVNVTARHEDEWIGRGITETVIADLRANQPRPVLAAERLAEAAATRPRDPEANDTDGGLLPVARQLGARWLVTGGYQRVGDQLRITARLLETTSGTVLQTLKADGGVDAVLDLQDRIVSELLSGEALADPWPSDGSAPDVRGKSSR